jgi:hypothetical protein
VKVVGRVRACRRRGGDQLRVLGGAGGDYERLVMLLVLHLGLLSGAV